MVDFISTWLGDTWLQYISSDWAGQCVTLATCFLGGLFALYIIDTLFGAIRQFWKGGK